MKQIAILALIAIGTGSLQAEITPKTELNPEGKYVPSQLDTDLPGLDFDNENSDIKIPKNSFDYPIRKGGWDKEPDGIQ
jgi:hypothetical protein